MTSYKILLTNFSSDVNTFHGFANFVRFHSKPYIGITSSDIKFNNILAQLKL
jgi:hypothetical protein